MLAFMWIAVGFNLIGFLMQFGTCCGVCCCSGRKKAVRKSQAVAGVASNGNGNVKGMIEKANGAVNENGQTKRRFGWNGS